jgi:hypothetical protein
MSVANVSMSMKRFRATFFLDFRLQRAWQFVGTAEVAHVHHNL